MNGAASTIRTGNTIAAASSPVAAWRVTATSGDESSTTGSSITGNTATDLGEVAIYSEFGFEGAVIANNTVDGAAIGIAVTNFNQGGRLAVVQGDPSTAGPFVYRIKMPPAYKIPPHTHKASENVTVLAGSFFIGVGEKFDPRAGHELPVGGFVSIPPQHPHFAWAGAQETVVQVHGVGPTDLTFVDPADDPRRKK